MAPSLATGPLAKGLTTLRKDERGGVLVPFSMMLVVLIACIGAGVDIGRWLHARTQTLAALDAAVLAGARALQLDEDDVNGALDAARKYFAENTAHSIALVSNTVSFQVNDDRTAVRSTGNAFIETPLLGLVGLPEMPLISESNGEFAEATLAQGGNSDTQTEISMMLDVTGSMAGQKVIDMKAAASDLIDIVVTDSSETKVALVPFSHAVRIPSSIATSVRGTVSNVLNIFGYAFRLQTNCVVERKGGNRYKDTAPGPGKYVMAMYDANSCTLGSTEQIVPLTNNKTTLKSAISGLRTNSGTAGQIGTAWAWYVLSPEWNSLWPSRAASAYDSGVKKIAILMTDGEYNTQYDSNGVNTGYFGTSPANGDSSTQAIALCESMKSKGITVYTVGFALGNSQTAINTLSTCATDAGKFYNAADGEALKQAFRDIALKISQLYLSK